jgi:SSS family solute:Na+ symporter
LMPDGYTLRSNADQIFPQFIVFALPVGISGFVMAGLLAAAMSSLSSGVNSSSSVIAEDFVKRFSKTRHSSGSQVRLVRQISVFVGVVVVGMSLSVGMAKGNLLEIAYRVVNLFVAPMFVLFCMALFIPWATVFGTFVAAAGSVGVAVAIAYFDFFNLGFLWILPVSLAVGVISGAIASLVPIGPRPRRVPLQIA